MGKSFKRWNFFFFPYELPKISESISQKVEQSLVEMAQPFLKILPKKTIFSLCELQKKIGQSEAKLETVLLDMAHNFL